jgi:hypothetical protein
MSKFKYYNPKASVKRNKKTNESIRKHLREGKSIGVGFSGVALQYGKMGDKEFIITTSNPGGNVLKIEEF